jgi:hypothetical protein
MNTRKKLFSVALQTAFYTNITINPGLKRVCKTLVSCNWYRDLGMLPEPQTADGDVRV